MIRGYREFSRALRSEVGRQMFTSVPNLVLFISLILLAQSVFFFFYEMGRTGSAPAIIALIAFIFCFSFYLYNRNNSRISHYSLLIFLMLLLFYFLELYLMVFQEIYYIWSLLLLIQILAGYYLLSNRFFYSLTTINVLLYGNYIVRFMVKDFDPDSLFALISAFVLALLVQKDRRQSLVTLAESYEKQKETNNRFKQLEENISQIFILCSADFQRFYHVSSALEKIMFLSKDDLKMDPEAWMKYIHSGDRLRVELELDIAQKEPEQREFDFRFVSPERESWLRFKLFPVKSGQSETVDRFAVIVDNITEEKQAELKLAEARSLDGEMAARIQRNLLFSNPRVQIEGLDTAADSIPSLDVGGDYFDLYRFSDNIVDVIIADVMGKGRVAAMLGAASKSAFLKSRLDLTVNLQAIPPIDRIVYEASQSISGELIKMGKFITLQYARLDMEKELFSFIDNGHTSILHYSPRLKSCWSLKGWNMPLGFNPEEEEITSIIPVEEGDLFFFYSDGIIEAENEEGEQFGERRLTYLLKNSAELSSSQIINKVKNLIFHYSSSESYSDDVTCIAMKTSDFKREAVRTDAVIEGKRESLQIVRTFTTGFLRKEFSRISPDTCNSLILAVNEAVANIIEHTYEKDPELTGREILIEAGRKGDYCYFRFFWDGVEFDWSVIEAPELSEMKGGGYGVSLMKEIMDSVSYSSSIEGVQQLCLVKEIKSEK